MSDLLCGFCVVRRNYGHWDIVNSEHGRLFRVRGGPGKYIVMDERRVPEKREVTSFKTVGACMSYICDELMFELIIAEGQEPQVIEKWNV